MDRRKPATRRKLERGGKRGTGREEGEEIELEEHVSSTFALLVDVGLQSTMATPERPASQAAESRPCIHSLPGG